MSTSDSAVSALQELVGGDWLLVLIDNIIWPIVLVMSLVIAVLVPQTFKNLQTIELILFLSVPLGLLSLAEAICLLSGHFDLSVGAIAGFSAMFTAMMFAEWELISNPIVGIAVILGVGSLIGFINGVMISKVGINPFLQTLAFFIILHGAKTALSPLTISGFPEGYLFLGNNSTTAILVLLAAFFLAEFVTNYTNFGQTIYGLGSNIKSATAVGINADRMVIAVFTISGLLSGLAGLMLTGYLTVVPADIARGQIFPAFTAAVIGGISLFGGRGKIRGVLGGVLLLGIIQTALNVSGVQAAEIRMINGIVLLFAIIVYTGRKRMRDIIIASGP